MISMKTLRRSISLAAIFVVVVVMNLMSVKAEVAYASMSNLSFGPSGSTVGTFLQADETIATFQISPGIGATGYYICTRMPSGTVLNIGNTAAADFVVEQNGGTVGPASLNTSWWVSNRDICLGMTSALDADSVITVSMSGSASGNEIQFPPAATNSGTFAINAPALGDVLNISNVSLVPDVATQILVETEADGTGTVVPEQTLWSGDSLTAYSNTRDQYDNFVANVAATWSLQGKTGGVANGDLVPSGDNKSAVFTGDGEGTTAIRATSGALTAIDSETIAVEEEYCGDGVGSEISPYGICDWKNLYNVRDHMDAHYILMNDLNAASVGYAAYASSTANAGAGWQPIGGAITQFTGSFDGNEHAITGLYVNRPATEFSGLFGYIRDNEVSDLGLIGADITGRDYVGGLAGVGTNSNISNCYTTGHMTGRTDVGGLVGLAGGSISNSYSRGIVTATSSVAGGLVGSNSSASISNSYSTGLITSPGSAGGLIGSNSGTVTGSFYDSETSGKSDAGKGVPKTTSQMKTASTFTGAGWDFEDVWAMGGGLNNGYAYLQFEFVTHTLTYTAGDHGSITGDSPQTVVEGGDGTAITAVAADRYVFSRWSDGLTANPRTDTDISENISVSAIFTAIPSGAFASPSVPKVVIPPSFSNDSINSSVSNAYQMAVSDSEDFSGSAWQDYDESYKTSVKILYVKFRSKDGGVSEVYKVGGSQMGDGNRYEGKLVKYVNLPKVYKIEGNKKRWIVNEEAFNYYKYNWQDIILVAEEFVDGENIVKPTILSGFYNFTRNLEQGDTGEDVRELQRYLNNNGFVLSPAGQPGSLGNETTAFGIATKNALIEFQQSVNLPAYGYFGPMTINVLNNRS